MSFRTWAALAVAALVVAPLVAHLLRRRPPEEQPFPAARLVPEAHAIASRRTAIQDRALFALRALSVLALAVLGATPLFRCSRLTLARPSGASVAVAIVLDDSLSMRARDKQGGPTRFDRAQAGAKELLASLQPGDAVAVVLAGRPARVALGSTSNLEAARATLEGARPTDRGTDVDGALLLARELVVGLAHVDKRIVVLGDLEADPGARADEPGGVAVSAPLDELRGAVDDCGIVHASRSGSRVTVRVGCTRGAPGARGAPAPSASVGAVSGVRAGARRVAIVAGDETLAESPVHLDGAASDLGVTLSDASLERHAGKPLTAVLRGADAIAEDDSAPVLSTGAALRAAIVLDPAESRVPTGGAPLVEQALRAMELGFELTPMAVVPEPREELDPYALLLVEDAPGLTPTQRRDVAAWVERGGVALVTLGPRAAAAPLGMSFGALVPALVRWRPSPVKGLAGPDALFADAADGLDDLAPRGRASLELEPGLTEIKHAARWQDGAPFLIEHRLGRGLVLVSTLPLAASESDFALRPALFALLERLANEARARVGAGRVTVGAALEAAGGLTSARFVDGRGREEALALPRLGAGELVAERAGLYEFEVSGVRSTRVAGLDEREFAAAPLDLAASRGGAAGAGEAPPIDVSSEVALALLGLLVVELLLRARGAIRARREAGSLTGA